MNDMNEQHDEQQSGAIPEFKNNLLLASNFILKRIGNVYVT